MAGATVFHTLTRAFGRVSGVSRGYLLVDFGPHKGERPCDPVLIRDGAEMPALKRLWECLDRSVSDMIAAGDDVATIRARLTQALASLDG